MIVLTVCVEVACDGCQSQWWLDNQEAVPHFVTTTEAAGAVTEVGWVVHQDGRALCPLCAAAEICRAAGHTFAPAQPCRCEGRIPAHRAFGCVPWRDCVVCGHVGEALDATSNPDDPEREVAR